MYDKILKYEKVVGRQSVETIFALAERLSDKTVKMVNSTAVGGGVAEILHRLVPLFNELGVQTTWEVIKGGEEFFNITKTIHNSLHGKEEQLSPEMEQLFLEVNRDNMRSMKLDQDYIFIHDPQPIALVEDRTRYQGKWVWRCHIDVSSPFEPVWNFVKNYVERYDVSIFSAPSFARELRIPQFQISPSIDPLSQKNRDVYPGETENLLQRYRIDPGRPIITQISRFDKLKDPLGVIETYKLVKKIPTASLFWLAELLRMIPNQWRFCLRSCPGLKGIQIFMSSSFLPIPISRSISCSALRQLSCRSP